MSGREREKKKMGEKKRKVKREGELIWKLKKIKKLESFIFLPIAILFVHFHPSPRIVYLLYKNV